MDTYIFPIIFLIYFLGAGWLLKKVLQVFFDFERSFSTLLLGIFLGVILLSFVLGIGVLFLPFSQLLFIGAFTISAIIVSALFALAAHYDTDMRSPESLLSFFSSFEMPNLTTLFGIFAYLAVALYGFYLLHSSRSGASVVTPWITIQPLYIYFFALATCILGALIIFKAKTSIMLLLLSVHALLLSSYLPLSHELFFGADGWRHVAIERSILSGGGVPEAIISDASIFTTVLSQIGRFSYSIFWALSILVHLVTRIDLVVITAWLMPVVWSLFVPLILFKIGESITEQDEHALFFSWLAFLPFSLQAAASFSLPSNISFVIWLFALLLLLRRLREVEPQQLVILVLFGIILTFGYALYAVLFWLLFFVVETVRVKETFSWFSVIILFFILSSVIPLVEWRAGFNVWNGFATALSGIQQAVGNFSAYYLATGPRPHAISTGNILFNQAPSYAFVATLFTRYLWTVFAFAVLFFGAVFSGVVSALKDGFGIIPAPSGVNASNEKYHRLVVSALSWFGASVAWSYLVSRYFFQGSQLLSRRLDVVLGFVCIIFLFIVVVRYSKILLTSVFGLVLVIVITFGISASYALGPNTGTVSLDEYQAMRYIWQQESVLSKHCIIAATYPLLALEALSEQKIIGGGFPIDHNFAQPELSELLDTARRDISVLDARRGIEATGSDHCFLVQPAAIPVSYFIKESGATVKHFNSIDVWRFGKQ